MIDENELSSAPNILSTTKLKQSKLEIKNIKNNPLATIDQNGYC